MLSFKIIKNLGFFTPIFFVSVKEIKKTMSTQPDSKYYYTHPGDTFDTFNVPYSTICGMFSSVGPVLTD